MCCLRLTLIAFAKRPRTLPASSVGGLRLETTSDAQGALKMLRFGDPHLSAAKGVGTIEVKPRAPLYAQPIHALRGAAKRTQRSAPAPLAGETESFRLNSPLQSCVFETPNHPRARLCPVRREAR